MKRLPLSIALLVVIASHAQAAVYRCEVGGQRVFTDRPCDKNREAATLPSVTTIARDPAAANLAKQYDAEDKAESDQHAVADAAWVRSHEARRNRQAAVRKGLIEGRVVAGMSRDEVKRVLDVPSSIQNQGEANERWIYVSGRERTVVAFKDGVVTTARSSQRSN